MKKILLNAKDQVLSKDEMLSIKGGWCYSASCSCGGVSFAVNPGGMGNYIEVVQFYCGAGEAVSCGDWARC